MPIKVYGSITSRKPDEVHEAGGLTLDAWMAKKVPNYEPRPNQRVTITVNGQLIDPERWADVVVHDDDQVDIRVRPQGGWVGDALGVVFPFWGGSVAAAQAAINYLTPDIRQPGSGQQGSQLEPAEAKANTARLNQIIPELFGTHIRYPDYLCQPRRYYVDKRTQALDLTLSVGSGEFNIDPANIKIGDTPVGQLGQVVSYSIHAPGATLPAAYKNWHSSPEVGASTGSAGIRLLGLPEGTIQYSDTSAATDTDTISSIESSDYWKPGYYVAVDVFQSVDVTSDAGGDILTGNFQHLSVGRQVFIKEQDGSFGSTYPSGLLGRVLTMNASNTEMTLEDTSGTPAPITDIDPGTYSADVADNFVSFEVASTTSTSLTLVAEDNLGNPVSPSLPTVSGATVELDFQFNDFTEIWSGPFQATPKGETAASFEVDIFAPQGLGVIDGSNVNSRSREIEIQYRGVGSSSWTSETRTISGATRDQLGWTFQITPATPRTLEVRVRRNDVEDRATTSLDRIEWTGLRAELPRADSYPGVTTMTMTIEGSDQLATSSENRINVVATRKIPTRSGGSWTSNTATSDIAAAMACIAKDAGYTDSDIDLAELDRLHGIWDGRGDKFDFIFDGTTVKEAMNTVLRAGMAELTIAGGILTPVRDEPRTTFEQAYSPANMTGPLSRSFQTIKPNETDGVEVEYIDANTWTTETVKCLLPGDNGFKLDKMKLDGVTDRTRAWRIGMRRRRAQRYRRYTYSFQTELDALNSDYLSYVPLYDEAPGQGKVALLLAIESDPGGAKLTVSEPLPWTNGQPHVIAYRNPEGKYVGPFAATQGDTEYEVIANVPEPWPDLSARQEPPHVFFGSPFGALITEITPSGNDRCSVQATNYDARVYLDDDSSPP